MTIDNFNFRLANFYIFIFTSHARYLNNTDAVLLSKISFIRETQVTFICLRITVHAKTRQGAGFEGMVHEHPERHRGRPLGGGENANRGDVSHRCYVDTNEWSRKSDHNRFPLFLISGNSGFAIPGVLSRGSTMRNSAMRKKSRSHRSPTSRSGSSGVRSRTRTTRFNV